MPSLRHCFGGPPPSAIHGRGRLPRHPCRGAPCATPAFGLWERGGRSEAKATATARSKDRSLASLDSSYRVTRSLEVRPAGRPPRFGFCGTRPLERPSGGSAQWATLHGWRRAHGAGPERGHAEPRRGTERQGHERFGYFPPGRAGFSKVTRCKSETTSRHDRRNGYVHHQKKRRLTLSHREQARSHRVMCQPVGSVTYPKSSGNRCNPPCSHPENSHSAAVHR